MVVLYFLILIVSCFLLVKSTDIVIFNLKGLAEKAKIGVFAVSSFLAALGTSFPEIFVSLIAAFKGSPNLALGTVIGSNIANLSLIIGGAALLGGKVEVRGKFLKTDIFYTFLAGAAPMVLLVDKVLSRLDGLILLAIYTFYQLSIFQEKPQFFSPVEDGFIHRLIRRINHLTTRRELGWIIFGFAILTFTAEVLVETTQKLSLIFNLPVLFFGLIVVALGTSLPELTFSLKAIKTHHPQMVFGNLLGSVVTNATLIMGLVSLISPVKIEGLIQYLLATMVFTVIFGIFYLLVRTKHRLERWEGAVLIIFYFLFILLEFIRF